MLESITLEQAIGAIVTIAVLLQRLPRWKQWNQQGLKVLIVTGLSVLAPFVIAGLQAEPHIAANLQETLYTVFMGLAMAAATFLFHKADLLFTAFVKWLEGQLEPA